MGKKMFFQCINLVLFPFTYGYVYGGYCFAILGRDCRRGGVARKRCDFEVEALDFYDVKVKGELSSRRSFI